MDLEKPPKSKIPVENKSLEAQTPGLDRTRPLRDVAIRGASWIRERPALALGVVGGLAVVGLGTWIALRTRRPERWHRRMLARLRELT